MASWLDEATPVAPKKAGSWLDDAIPVATTETAQPDWMKEATPVDTAGYDPALVSSQIPEEKYQEIAAKHGVPVEKLKQYAPYGGASEGPLSTSPQEIAGFAGQTLGMVLPQKLYRSR